MRALKLHANDIELYESGLSPERVQFFTCHVNAFKRMWTEEGLTYWLRFLVTFKFTLERNVVKRPECCIVPFRIGSVLLNFVYISIHQKFIEGKCNSAKQLIKHIFTLARFFSNLADSNSVHRNPFNTKDSREAFRNLLGKPDFLEDYPMPMVAFACTAYFEFAGAVCSLLKRWISEPDLNEAELEKIDISKYYWMPFEEWEEKSYTASCFEKYVSDYWGEDLPRMLLTTNVNDIFNSHVEKGNCCSLYKKNVNIFDIFKSQSQFFHAEEKCIIPVKIIVPSVVQCDEHKLTNCYIKIKHDSSCSEPFICNGKKPCVLVCETYKAEKLKNHKIENVGWKTFHADTFTCKQKNKRNVCTLAENFDRSIETYLLKENEHFQLSVDPKKLSLDAKLFIDKQLGCCSSLPLLDPECLNYIEQIQRRIDYKKKLQKKLVKKHLQINNTFEAECTADSAELLDICKKAQELFLLDLVIDKYYSTLDSSKCLSEGQEENGTFCSITDAMNTIALGTHDVVYGRVILPLKRFQSQKCQTECSALSQEICNSKMHHSREASKRSKSAKKLKSSNKVINGENLKSKEDNIIASNICEQGKNIPMASETELKNDFQKDESSEELKPENKVTADIGLEIKEGFCDSKCKPNTHVDSCTELLISSEKTITSVDNNIDEKADKVTADIGLEIKEERYCDSKCNANTHVDSCTELLISSEKTITSIDNNIDEKADSFKSDCDAQLIISGSSSMLNIGNIDMVDDVSRHMHNEPTAVELNGEIYDSEDIIQNFNKSQHSASVQLNSYSSCDEILFENLESDYSMNVDVSSQDEKLVDKFFALILNGNRASSPVGDPVSKVVKDKAVPDCSGDKRIKLKTCAYCGEKEIKCKTFKRCSRCKVENFKQQRYYCSRDCQVSDWEESHRDEHSKQT